MVLEDVGVVTPPILQALYKQVTDTEYRQAVDCIYTLLVALRPRAADPGLGVRTACGGFQGRVEGKSFVPIVLEAVALNSTGREGQKGIEPFQSLSGGVFIGAEF